MSWGNHKKSVAFFMGDQNHYGKEFFSPSERERQRGN